MNELKEKIETAKNALDKRTGITEKLIKKSETLKNKLEQLEIDYRGNFYTLAQTNYEHYELASDYNSLLEDIKSSQKKEQERLSIYNNCVAKYEATLVKSNEIAKLPECFQETISYLVESWTKGDLERKNLLQNKREELTREEFYKKSFYNEYCYYAGKEKEDFLKINKKDAEDLVVDLISRITSKVGEITDLKHIEFNGNALNGFVTGERGKCQIETIIAGGYNIQKAHYRVLVKDIEKTKRTV